jgi:hypothetical protein
MKQKHHFFAVLLLSTLTAAPSFAQTGIPATNEGLRMIFANVVNSLNKAMGDVKEDLRHIQLQREDFNNIVVNLNQLLSLTDFDNVKSKSGKTIEGIVASIDKLKTATPHFQQIVDDFDQLLEVLKTKDRAAPEVTPLLQKALMHAFDFSPFVPETEVSRAINTLVKLLYKLHE